MKRVIVVVALLGAVFATPSSASTYYDYWGYWHKSPNGDGSWEYSKVGPSGYSLKPGTQVEGWRYAIGTASQSDPKPRPTGVRYDDYCKGQDSTATYRVLLVVDYGTQSGAPSGPVYSCYGFDSQPSGFQVLTKEHTERDSGGLICAIDTYPKSGCGEVVSSPSPKPTRTTTASQPPPTKAPTATKPPATTTGGSTTTPIAPDATTSASARGTTTKSPPAQATDDVTTAPSPGPSGSTDIVAKQFVPPHRRSGIPFGFIAATVFVVALVGAVLWQQRRRRAG